MLERLQYMQDVVMPEKGMIDSRSVTWIYNYSDRRPQVCKILYWRGSDLVSKIFDTIDEAEAWLTSQPDADTVKKLDATRKLGRAIDACEEAGIDGLEPVREQFHNIHERLLTCTSSGSPA